MTNARTPGQSDGPLCGVRVVELAGIGPGPFAAMLLASIPNVEMHIYGNGRHPGEMLSDGSRMSAGLADRNGIPFGTWQDRFIDWFRDLGFLQKAGVETKAATDVTAFVTQRNSK